MSPFLFPNSQVSGGLHGTEVVRPHEEGLIGGISS